MPTSLTSPNRSPNAPTDRVSLLLETAAACGAKEQLIDAAARNCVSIRTVAQVYAAAAAACRSAGGQAALANPTVARISHVSLAQTNRAMAALAESGMLVRQRRRGPSVTSLPEEPSGKHEPTLDGLTEQLERYVGDQVHQSRWQQRLLQALTLGHSADDIVAEMTRSHEGSYSPVGLMWHRLGVLCSGTPPKHMCVSAPRSKNTPSACDQRRGVLCDVAKVTEAVIEVLGPQAANHSWQADIAQALRLRHTPDFLIKVLTEDLDGAHTPPAAARRRLQRLIRTAHTGASASPDISISGPVLAKRETSRKRQPSGTTGRPPYPPPAEHKHATKEHPTGSLGSRLDLLRLPESAISEASSIIVEVCEIAKVDAERMAAEGHVHSLAEYLHQHPTARLRIVIGLVAGADSALSPEGRLRWRFQNLVQCIPSAGRFLEMHARGAWIHDQAVVNAILRDGQRQQASRQARAASERADAAKSEEEARQADAERLASEREELAAARDAAERATPSRASNEMRSAIRAVAGRPAQYARFALSKRVKAGRLTEKEAADIQRTVGFDPKSVSTLALPSRCAGHRSDNDEWCELRGAMQAEDLELVEELLSPSDIRKTHSACIDAALSSLPDAPSDPVAQAMLRLLLGARLEPSLNR